MPLRVVVVPLICAKSPSCKFEPLEGEIIAVNVESRVSVLPSNKVTEVGEREPVRVAPMGWGSVEPIEIGVPLKESPSG